MAIVVIMFIINRIQNLLCFHSKQNLQKTVKRATKHRKTPRHIPLNAGQKGLFSKREKGKNDFICTFFIM